ncbi:hypothetical protein QQ045_019193 [Rhodiola kirilowii]
MEFKRRRLRRLFAVVLFCYLGSLRAQALQTDIIQLHTRGAERISKTNWRLSLLEQVVLSRDDPSSRLLYSYNSAMEGFAATLSNDDYEVQLLQKVQGVMAARPDRRLELHTTYSYKFLGLKIDEEHGAWRESNFGRDTIIGLLDTGAWPESTSFNDTNMPPIPKKWRGVCQEGQNFT